LRGNDKYGRLRLHRKARCFLVRTQPGPCTFRSGREPLSLLLKTTFSCQMARRVLYLFSWQCAKARNPIPKLRRPPPLAGAGHRGYEEPRGAKRSSVKSGSWVSSIAALRCQRSRPARALRSSGCAMSFARSSLSVCRSRQPNSSPFRSAVSTKHCSYLSARCTRRGGYELRGRRSCRQNRPRARPLSRIRRCPAVARGNGGAPAPAACRASARARSAQPE
jgi:hypothetical protein